MVSVKHLAGLAESKRASRTLIVDEYKNKENAEFSAYLDIQEELAEQKDFALPLEGDLVEFLSQREYY